MRCDLIGVVVLVVATLGFFGGFCEADEVPVKYNQTGKCYANTSNCDWFVGVWMARFDYSGYSCSGNGVSTFPLSPKELCCTEMYSVMGICTVGYREDSGVLVSACVLDSGRFNNKTENQPLDSTLRQNMVMNVASFEKGLQTINAAGVTTCYPFRQLTTDNWVANLNSPEFAAGNAACPSFPNPALTCNQAEGKANTYTAGRRRIPASRNNGYHVTKNFNTAGSCSIHNGNCDWFAGSWNGYVVAQGFSNKFVLGLQDFVFPLTPSDVLCASSPYLIGYNCETGYSTISGNFVSQCFWGSGQIFPVDTTLSELYGYNHMLHVEEYTEYRIITSLQNGIQLNDTDLGISGCTPMDRLDSDTVIGNVFPSFPLVNCAAKNISPDLNVRCQSNGELSVNVGYFVMVRTYGSGTTGGPIYIASFSSGMILQQPIMMVMAVLLMFLGFFMM